MIKNPIHLRLEKLTTWQLRLFMVCLCERMFPNFVLYCRQIDSDVDKTFQSILALNWEMLIVKKAKINFDSQLEKLENIIPSVDEVSPYSIYPALDACEALSELIHSYLSGEELAKHAVAISQISIKTIIELEKAKDDASLTEAELEKTQAVLDELDIQWEIYRILKDEEQNSMDLIKGLKCDLQEDPVSNIGVFLTH